MAKGRIHIGNLQLRLPRSATAQARSIAAHVGRDLLRTLSESAPGMNGNIEIKEIVAGKFRSADSASVGKNVASKVLNQVKAR